MLNISKNKKLLLVALLLVCVFFVSFINQASARSGTYQFIDRVFFGELLDSDPDRWDSVIAQAQAQGENIGLTNTIGIGKNCSGSDTYGPTCDEYFFAPDPLPETSEIIFYNTRILTEPDNIIEDRQIVVSENPPVGLVQSTDGMIEDSTVNIRDPDSLATHVRAALEAGEQDFAEEDREATCEDLGDFAWAVCPLIRGISGLVSWVDSQMTSLLRLEPGRYNNDQLRESWVIFRNIAYVLLVPAMLVMVIGTALGFEFVSAYTVKSALPRMIIATIFIALSFDLMVFVVNAVQAIGNGMQNIILSPFTDINGNQLTSDTGLGALISPSVGSGFVNYGILAGIIAAIVSASSSGAIGGTAYGILLTILGVVGTGALLLLAVFVLLLFRQTIIIVLMLVAPLAILAWIFPGRTRLFGLWSKTFWLMMWFFPLIMIAVGVGKAMASILAGQ